MRTAEKANQQKMKTFPTKVEVLGEGGTISTRSNVRGHSQQPT